MSNPYLPPAVDHISSSRRYPVRTVPGMCGQILSVALGLIYGLIVMASIYELLFFRPTNWMPYAIHGGLSVVWLALAAVSFRRMPYSRREGFSWLVAACLLLIIIAGPGLNQTLELISTLF